MSSKTSILAALVAPLPQAEFLGRHWPERAYAAHGGPERLPAALRAPELQSVEAMAEKYRGRMAFGNAVASSRTVGIEHTSPALLVRMGLSLYLPDLVPLVPALDTMLRQLEQELGAPGGSARIGAFAAAPGNGASCHFDAEEVFSIQLRGEKRFHIAKAPDIEQPWGMQFNPGDPSFDDLYPQVSAGFPDPASCEFETVEMKPGSVLFMPRGTWHYTESRDSSLSASIIVRTPAAFECALEALRLRLLQDVRWRRPLYGAWGDAAQAGEAQASWRSLMQDWARVTGGLSLDDALLTRQDETERLQRVDATSRFQRCPEARMEFEPKAQGGETVRIVVRTADGDDTIPLHLEVPEAMAAAFRWLASHAAAFAVAELASRFPAIPLAQHLGIVNVLARAHYLRQLWYGPIPAEAGA